MFSMDSKWAYGIAFVAGIVLLLFFYLLLASRDFHEQELHVTAFSNGMLLFGFIGLLVTVIFKKPFIALLGYFSAPSGIYGAVVLTYDLLEQKPIALVIAVLLGIGYSCVLNYCSPVGITLLSGREISRRQRLDD